MGDALVDDVARVLYETMYGSPWDLADECFQQIGRDLARAALAVVQPESDRLCAALERITRECDALNKGPVAVSIARAALEGRKDG